MIPSISKTASKYAASAAVMIAAAATQAQVSGTNLGTAAPPSSLDGYSMSAGSDGRATFSDVTSANVGGGRTVDFSTSMSLRRIGDGWATWSHGYTGPVYFTPNDRMTMRFDSGEVGAFIVYVEPNQFGEFSFEITGRDASGSSVAYNANIVGDAGAMGFGFSAPAGGHITSVRVLNTDGNSGGFAVGEFLSAGVESGCLPWRPFTFGGLGDVVSENIAVGVNCGLLKVTDAFNSGDQFRVRVFQGASLVTGFTTSTPRDGFTIGADYDAAYASRNFSSGSAELAPGRYRVEITVIDSPFGAGGAALRLDSTPCDFGSCRADFDGDGTLTIFDFLAFQNAFGSGSRCADFDGDGALTIFDFLRFQNEFSAGC
ncbi:MAG: GC-type dockerin domain-anchored protein [Phycisphaerales bacterium JB060]